MAMQTPNTNAAYLVAGKGEEAVLAGNIDPMSFAILSQFGINGFSGFRGSVKDIIQLYRQARINHAPTPIRVNNDQGTMVPVYIPVQVSGGQIQNVPNQMMSAQRLAARQNSIPNSQTIGIK